jgi:hypothetical protein
MPRKILQTILFKNHIYFKQSIDDMISLLYYWLSE